MTDEPGSYVDEYRWIRGRLLQWDGQRWVVPLGGAGPDRHPARGDLRGGEDLDDLATPSED
ncbi:hypothetical protein [Cellulosimicrobium sp. Marseille-Q4280]|jgi:hypothetical protein|uniref:hypothetical protein n=1 Tax=Cellulosimicrobium sp. Marseille-Q4280 TaxID=2937992 RepID=UPI002041ED5B|nr:hypothetical protein [Cellulosimicrobium sp. Marseille-Q4280]